MRLGRPLQTGVFNSASGRSQWVISTVGGWVGIVGGTVSGSTDPTDRATVSRYSVGGDGGTFSDSPHAL